MKYKLKIPTPSAKRFLKNRRFIIEAYSIGELTDRREFILPENETHVEFEWEDESIKDEWILDGNILYLFTFEFRNETATRIEKVEFYELPLDALVQ